MKREFLIKISIVMFGVVQMFFTPLSQAHATAQQSYFSQDPSQGIQLRGVGKALSKERLKLVGRNSGLGSILLNHRTEL